MTPVEREGRASEEEIGLAATSVIPATHFSVVWRIRHQAVKCKSRVQSLPAPSDSVMLSEVKLHYKSCVNPHICNSFKSCVIPQVLYSARLHDY